MSACPEETEMLQLIEGQLDPAHRERLEAHIDTCAACAEWLAAMAAVLAPEPDDLQASSSDGYAPAPTPQETLIDERYRIEAMVGAGAMGVVYVADDQRLSRQVALKLMRPDILEPELRARVQERMLREAQSLATLAHPNVVSVHDVGSWHERVFIAMEYVRGASLSQWIRDRDPPWRDILDAWLQACDGLAAAHDAGLVHRDIKPDNLLVGDDGRVRLTDFGLAGAFEDLHAPRDPARSTAKGVWATRTGLLIGTPAYMSPEQLDGHRATAQSDQFSLCVALYESLYHTRPFHGDSIAQLRDAIAQGPSPLPPATASTRPPEPLHTAIARGLSPKPEARYPSIGALKTALLAAVAPSPSHHRGPIAFTPLTLTIAALLGLVPLGLIAFLSVEALTPSTTQPTPLQTQPTSTALPPSPNAAQLRDAQLHAAQQQHAAAVKQAQQQQEAFTSQLRRQETLGRISQAFALALQKRDPRQCLQLMGQHRDLLEQPHANHSSIFATQVSACLMLLGRCDQGRQMFEKSYRAQLQQSSAPFSEEIIQGVIQNHLDEWCTIPHPNAPSPPDNDDVPDAH